MHVPADTFDSRTRPGQSPDLRRLGGGLCVLLLVGSLEASTSEAADRAHQLGAGPEVSMRVRLCDTTGLTPAGLLALEEEVALMYSWCSVRLLWLEECSDQASLAVTSMARVCILSSSPSTFRIGMASLRHREPLGWESRIASSPESRSYVCRGCVENRLKAGSVSLTERAVARALGRVIAHELAHSFLGPKHTSRGILQSGLDAWELTRESSEALFFTARQAAVVHARLVPKTTPAIPADR